MKMKRLTMVSLAAGVLAGQALPVLAQPSFDCAAVRAGSPEEMICGDEGLAALDSEMDRLYRKIEAQTSAEDFKTIHAMQQGWLSGRNEGWKQADPRQWVEDSYRERIAVLSVQAGEVTVPDPVEYTCSGGAFDGLTAVFYDTDPPVGVFTRTPPGDWPQYIATGWDDDGAVHYNIGGLDFIDRDGKADLNWAGTPMQCQRM
ncbi:lysozyme inhibitor LprI family protein [Nitratireductor pacificus]|nr:lysozyme inhibitor LprI family protein [Nitratireductor pacificus]